MTPLLKHCAKLRLYKTVLTPGNPFAKLEKIQRLPCDIYVEKSILTNLTASYELEIISRWV